MSAPKWTPGPWGISTHTRNAQIGGQRVPLFEIESKADACWVAYVQNHVNCITTPSGSANAHLIAAAPELYAEHYADDQLLMKVATVILNDKIADHLPSGLREEFEARLRRGTPALHKAESEARP